MSSNSHSPHIPQSKAFRDRAEECRTMAELYHGEKTRAALLRVAAEYNRMADQAAMFELEHPECVSPAPPKQASDATDH